MLGVTRFSARTQAEAVVPADRADLWAILTDPDQLTELTPFLHAIDAVGDRWLWEMTRLEVLGVGVAPVFTERMVFSHLERIEFRHEPPTGTRERAGVNGWYALAEVDGGTHLATSLEVELELPLARVAGARGDAGDEGRAGRHGRPVRHEPARAARPPTLNRGDPVGAGCGRCGRHVTCP